MNIDLDALAQEFNMDSSQPTFDEAVIDIGTLPTDKLTNPDEILATNVNKANAILDRVIIEINRSGMSPRLGEVASQLIATINQAASQIYTKDLDIGNLQLKRKLVELKEREIVLKERISQVTSHDTVNNNLIVADRETVLRLLLENKEKIKLLGNNGENNGTEEES